MINEIIALKQQLDFHTEIKLKFVRYDYETTIQKEDIVTKIDQWSLKVVRPSGEVCIINVEFVMLAYIGKKMEW